MNIVFLIFGNICLIAYVYDWATNMYTQDTFPSGTGAGLVGERLYVPPGLDFEFQNPVHSAVFLREAMAMAAEVWPPLSLTA